MTAESLTLRPGDINQSVRMCSIQLLPDTFSNSNRWPVNDRQWMYVFLPHRSQHDISEMQIHDIYVYHVYRYRQEMYLYIKIYIYLYIYIYIFSAFSRRFYPKRLPINTFVRSRETTIFRCRYSKDVSQALTIARLTPSQYTPKLARIRCYTKLSSLLFF